MIKKLDNKKPKVISGHRLFIPCKECKGKLEVPINKSKGTITCSECGWEVEYTIENE